MKSFYHKYDGFAKYSRLVHSFTKTFVYLHDINANLNLK